MDIALFLKDSKIMISVFITSSEEKSSVLAPIALKLYNGKEESLSYDENGRPVFESTDVSISHSGEYWCCAFFAGTCGIDIERIREIDYMRLSGRFFASSEKKMVTDQESFFRIWTAKESYAKYTGRGLIRTMKDSPFENHVHIHSENPAEGYIMSICTAQPETPVVRYFEVD